MKAYFIFIALFCSSFSLLHGQGLSLYDGVQITSRNDAVVVVNDGSFAKWDNGAANLSVGFPLHMTGTIADSNATIISDGPIAIYDVVINKTQNGVRMDTSISFFGDLNMMNGNLDLNGQLLFFSRVDKFLMNERKVGFGEPVVR